MHDVALAHLELGQVEVPERFPGDPEGCAAYVRAALSEKVPADVRPRLAIGVAGTITQLATLDLGLEREEAELVHGHSLSAQAIEQLLRKLAPMPVDEIRSEEHTSELQSLRTISYAVFCLDRKSVV